jgi:co-chaperonin GroES (HSP10)
MNIYIPIEDRVLLKEIKRTELEKTEEGIIISDLAQKTSEAIVASVGPGRYATETGVFMPTSLGKNDTVLIAKGSGLPLTLDIGNGREDFLLMREADILLFIKKVDNK